MQNHAKRLGGFWSLILLSGGVILKHFVFNLHLSINKIAAEEKRKSIQLDVALKVEDYDFIFNLIHHTPKYTNPY